MEVVPRKKEVEERERNLCAINNSRAEDKKTASGLYVSKKYKLSPGAKKPNAQLYRAINHVSLICLRKNSFPLQNINFQST